MSSWGNYDNAANAPYWAVNSAVAPDNPDAAKPDAANVALLYANTTPDAYIVDATVGLFMVDANEQQVLEANGRPAAHSGWNLRTEGSGGRAGRVQLETLVAQSQIRSDNNADDAVLPDSKITITVQPTAVQTVSANSANTLTYSVEAAVTAGASVPLTYQWQVNNNAGGSWVNIPAGTNVTTGQPGGMSKSGANTATLVVDPLDTTANNYVFRCVVTNAAAGATATSANGRILITA